MQTRPCDSGGDLQKLRSSVRPACRCIPHDHPRTFYVADNESPIDLYNVQHLVAAVASTARNQRLLPVTIGVYGDWGSGKSTVVRMVKEQLEREEDTLCVYFNGWLFEGYEDAKAAIIGSILDELADKRRAVEKAGDLFHRLRKRVNGFRLMGWGIKTYFSVKAGLPPA